MNVLKKIIEAYKDSNKQDILQKINQFLINLLLRILEWKKEYPFSVTIAIKIKMDKSAHFLEIVPIVNKNILESTQFYFPKYCIEDLSQVKNSNCLYNTLKENNFEITCSGFDAKGNYNCTWELLAD